VARMIQQIVIPEERAKILKKGKLIKRIEEFVDAKIRLKDNEVVIDCKDVFIGLRLRDVFRAFGRGFDIGTALNLLDEEYFLEMIEVKEYSGKSRKRQVILKGRVIGRKGKMKKMIEKLADVKIAIYGKTISVIGKWKNLQIAKKAIEMLLEGAMHSTVYKFLERQKN
jgi:ribosomal RNA assembly protein